MIKINFFLAESFHFSASTVQGRQDNLHYEGVDDPLWDHSMPFMLGGKRWAPLPVALCCLLAGGFKLTPLYNRGPPSIV